MTAHNVRHHHIFVVVVDASHRQQLFLLVLHMATKPIQTPHVSSGLFIASVGYPPTPYTPAAYKLGQNSHNDDTPTHAAPSPVHKAHTETFTTIPPPHPPDVPTPKPVSSSTKCPRLINPIQNTLSPCLVLENEYKRWNFRVVTCPATGTINLVQYSGADPFALLLLPMSFDGQMSKAKRAYISHRPSRASSVRTSSCTVSPSSRIAEMCIYI